MHQVGETWGKKKGKGRRRVERWRGGLGSGMSGYRGFPCGAQNRMPCSVSNSPHRTGRVHQTAPVVTSSQANAESPMIAVSALLQLAGWAAARGQCNLQGGSSCLNLESSLSPPAPIRGDAISPAQEAVADASRQRPRPNPEHSQSRRRQSSHEGPASSGGDA